mmetsp:Transcript_6823/g.14282  ORF Transcript_6823/g.14282 Transcript_6823/m.14282 type:complete len:260 (-) Transcript_6823:154-933(-)
MVVVDAVEKAILHMPRKLAEHHAAVEHGVCHARNALADVREGGGGGLGEFLEVPLGPRHGAVGGGSESARVKIGPVLHPPAVLLQDLPPVLLLDHLPRQVAGATELLAHLLIRHLLKGVEVVNLPAAVKDVLLRRLCYLAVRLVDAQVLHVRRELEVFLLQHEPGGHRRPHRGNDLTDAEGSSLRSNLLQVGERVSELGLRRAEHRPVLDVLRPAQRGAGRDQLSPAPADDRHADDSPGPPTDHKGRKRGGVGFLSTTD